MLYDDEMQGHDSQVESITIDALSRTVSLRFSSYPSFAASDRIAIEVAFKNVTSITTTADLVALSINHGAGNVNHWHVAEGPGSSYFYLIEGCLVITAELAPILSYR